MPLLKFRDMNAHLKICQKVWRNYLKKETYSCCSQEFTFVAVLWEIKISESKITLQIPAAAIKLSTKRFNHKLCFLSLLLRKILKIHYQNHTSVFICVMQVECIGQTISILVFSLLVTNVHVFISFLLLLV